MDARTIAFHSIISMTQRNILVDTLLTPTPRTCHHAARSAVAGIPREHQTRLGACRLLDVHLRVRRARRARTGGIPRIAHIALAVAFAKVESAVLQIPHVDGPAGPSVSLYLSLPFSLTIALAIP